MREEKDGGVTANALTPAAFLGSYPSNIKVGISRKPGPTPKNPESIEMGIAKRIANLKFPLSFPDPFTGRKRL